mmetsp:Transcript_3331/g.9454  ORF Transcript_3331/g.9454 Transcript_3331/m.9454 type:complete len:211 (+) Transcript_3331:430-1062(+)
MVPNSVCHSARCPSSWPTMAMTSSSVMASVWELCQSPNGSSSSPSAPTMLSAAAAGSCGASPRNSVSYSTSCRSLPPVPMTNALAFEADWLPCRMWMPPRSTEPLRASSRNASRRRPPWRTPTLAPATARPSTSQLRFSSSSRWAAASPAEVAGKGWLAARGSAPAGPSAPLIDHIALPSWSGRSDSASTSCRMRPSCVLNSSLPECVSP